MHYGNMYGTRRANYQESDNVHYPVRLTKKKESKKNKLPSVKDH